MFGKKKQIPEKKTYNYIEWEKEFGFLNLIMTRKIRITKEFLIDVYNKQLSERDFLRDDDVEPLVDKGVKETLSQIGNNYKDFLIDKYFGTLENLVSFITEQFYVQLIAQTIDTNNKKIQDNSRRQIANLIQKMNKPEK